MKSVSKEFQKVIEGLIKEVSLENCTIEEFKLSHKYNALPFGYDLWSVVLLTPKGEIIDQDLDGNIQHHDFNQYTLDRLLVVEKDRFPQLEKFIPTRSEDSKECPACKGAKELNTKPDRIKCFVCVGLGWVTKEVWKEFIESQAKQKAEDDAQSKKENELRTSLFYRITKFFK